MAGLAISAYLTVAHYSATTSLACPETGTINCAKVTTSSWSHIGPVPLVLVGLVFFSAMSVLCSPGAWEYRSLDRARIAGAGVGVASAVYLIWVELFRLDAVCVWCTAVHACTVLLLGSVLWTGNALHNPG